VLPDIFNVKLYVIIHPVYLAEKTLK